MNHPVFCNECQRHTAIALPGDPGQYTDSLIDCPCGDRSVVPRIVDGEWVLVAICDLAIAPSVKNGMQPVNNPLIEHRLKADPFLFLAACSAVAWWQSEDLKDPADAFDALLKLIKAVENSDVWGQGKHSGDCTSHAHTCFRCMLEDYAETGERILSKMRNDGTINRK